MVRTLMSSENSIAGGPSAFCKAKEKVSVQQSLINSNARNLKRLKESTSRLSSNSPNLNGLALSSASDGEAPSAIDDDIKLQEKKLMKGFSNQLIEKHRFLKQLEDSDQSAEEVEKMKREFDSLINFEQFLNVAGLESISIQKLLEDDALTLDSVFQMQSSELDELALKFGLGDLERKLLYRALDHLSTFYEAWERGEKLTVTNLTRLRCTSTSRLNSISNLTGCEVSSSSVDVRLDSASCSYATRHSPLPLHLPSTSTTATSSPTPVTPSSSQSLLSPSSPFSAGLQVTSTPLNDVYAATPPTSTSYFVPIFTPPPLSPGPSPHPSAIPLVGPQALIRSHSSSSSILLGETPHSRGEPPHSRGLARNHHSVSSLNNNGSRVSGNHTPVGVPTISSPVQPPAQRQDSSPSARSRERHSGSSLRRRKPLTHKRSLSNPLANIILNQDNDTDVMRGDEGSADLPQHVASPNHTHSSMTPSSIVSHHYRSPSPPSRAGSHPSIHSNNVGGGGSPQPHSRLSSSAYHHPQMKRVAAMTPGFSQSVSSDFASSDSSNHDVTASSVLVRQNTWQSSFNWHSPDGNNNNDGSLLMDVHNESLVTPRCNSLAGISRPRSTTAATGAAHDSLLADLTSSSMVDLPVGGYSASTEHLSQGEDEECNLPNSSGKSRSVPRLTLMAVNGEGDGDYPPSASTPTSPSTPGSSSGQAVLMRHRITHRFAAKTYITPHVCDYCKKKLRIGVRCKDCKYKCHKSCASQAPHSCGLPKELMNFFRKHVAMASSTERLAEQRVEPPVQSPMERAPSRPPMERSSTYDLDMREGDQFYIPDLSSEPTTTHYSPVMNNHRSRAETVNGMSRHHYLSSQSSSTSLLEVPHSHSNRVFHSTSSTPSPSTSPPTSPSLTPSSPRSPNDYIPPAVPYPPQYRNHHHQRDYQHNRRTGTVRPPVFIKRSNELCDDYYEDDYSSDGSSINDISDQSRTNEDYPRGQRPPPQVIMAKSLPDLLLLSPTEKELDQSCAKFLERPAAVDKVSSELPPSGCFGGGRKQKFASRRVSLDDHGYHGSSNIRRKDSLQRTLSAADSKASTLVASQQDDNDSGSFTGSQDLPEDEMEEIEEDEEDGDYDDDDDDEECGDLEERRPGRSLQHRNSVVDEWSIPFESIKMGDCLGVGRLSKVHQGNWHGKVAIKHFYVPNATKQQVNKFKEEVSVLKRTRHENLALFMGACLHPPDLAIITIFCKGHTLYRSLHVWSEPFHLDKTINIAKQVAQAMGYLHARRIIHKNLNTRNIFVEKDKVVITDTGLSSLTESFYINEYNFLVVKRNKLCYLSPELIRNLSHYQMDENTWHVNFLHTDETDIYAFGTVLYELMLRKFPFHSDQYGFSYPPEVLIYMVGLGTRQEVQNKDIPKRMRELMYDCWHPNPDRRLSFKVIHEALIKMSRKKTPIVRSPSFPISLSKSTEGLNFLNA